VEDARTVLAKSFARSPGLEQHLKLSEQLRRERTVKTYELGERTFGEVYNQSSSAVVPVIVTTPVVPQVVPNPNAQIGSIRTVSIGYTHLHEWSGMILAIRP